MSEYYFVREASSIPRYIFSDEFSDAVPNSAFTYPSKEIDLYVDLKPKDEYLFPDSFDLPSYSIIKSSFDNVNLRNIYGVNWVEIKLIDKKIENFFMLQIANEIKIIDRVKTVTQEIMDFGTEDETIFGIEKLVLDERVMNDIPSDKRLIVTDPAWHEVFFHKTIVEEIEKISLVSTKFVPAEGYSEF